MRKKLTTEEFISRSKEVWGDRWDYSQTEYTKMGSHVTLVCSEHGEFNQIAQTHLDHSVGCPGCRWGVWDTASFITSAKSKHGERFDYSPTVYTKATNKVQIVCPIHGAFWQTPSAHMNSSCPCPTCLGRGINTEGIIKQFKNAWGDRYDYSKVEYVNYSTPVTITCRTHGEFSQVPSSHRKGHQGCQGCIGRVFDTASFIEVSQAIQSGHSYTSTEYKGNQAPVSVTCEEHGEYTTIADYHVQGHVTCPECKKFKGSKREAELLEFVKGLCPTEVHANNRTAIHPMELDIYVPELKLGIEFNGLYWHSEKFLSKDYHYTKYLRCQEKGIRLLQVWEDDWVMRGDIVREHIKHVLGKSTRRRVGARNVSVREIDSGQAAELLQCNHIQGFVGASVHLGLFESDALVGVASFQKSGEDYVLSRYVTSANIPGGHSKAVAYFERVYEYNKLVTFADLSFSDGDLYRKSGWIEDKLLKPDYSYLVKGSLREHKFKYRKKKFETDPKLKYVPGMTERELAELNGLLRIYDAGKIRFIKPHPIL